MHAPGIQTETKEKKTLHQGIEISHVPSTRTQTHTCHKKGQKADLKAPHVFTDSLPVLKLENL